MTPAAKGLLGIFRDTTRSYENIAKGYVIVLTITTDVISLFVDLAGTAVKVCDLLLSRSVVTLKLVDVLKLRSSDTVELLF